MCNVYYSFPCFPEKSSKLNTVFLAFSINSADIKRHGTNECLKPLVIELKKLESSGIEIKTSTGTKTVYFILGLILGDNLGLNTILNFAKSFSSNYYCRFCQMKKNIAQSSCRENIILLRNRINYMEDVTSNAQSETGVVSNSIFNSIPSFHVTENFSVDLMHDIFEGVCHYIFAESFLYFIKTMKYFDLNSLNIRLKSFSYLNMGKGSEKKQIIINELENRKLKLSASQMMAFCHYLPLILGDLIPHEDEVRKFILNFLELVEDVMQYGVSHNYLLQIEKKIEIVNKNY